jgi:hypothetical protein
LPHVVHNSESRRARIDLLTFTESADTNYPRLGVFTAVIKKNSKMSGSVIGTLNKIIGTLHTYMKSIQYIGCSLKFILKVGVEESIVIQ